MVLPWLAAATLGVAWVEITGGLPPHDDITTAIFGDHPDELWVGTFKGLVWHTDDGGKSWALAFWPTESEAMIAPGLTNYRAPSVGDLARGTDRNLSPRDRVSIAQRSGDLAGSVRDRPRDRGAALLGSITRRVERDRVRVKYISKCPGALFMFTAESVWRTQDEGVNWERLAMGPMGPTDTVSWVSCSHEQPGHLVINTAGGPLESFDNGDSFGLYKNPYPKTQLPPIAGPGEHDLLWVMHDNRLYQEQPDGGYKELAHIIGDSVESDSPGWTWEAPEWGLTYVITADGMLTLDHETGATGRLPDERLARHPIRFPAIDTSVEGHMLVANEHEVYESFDAGQTFDQIFTSPTERTIIRIMLHKDRTGDLIVVTGGQIWRRVWDDDAHLWEDAATTRRRVDKILQAAPLWEVVQTSLERFELRADQVGAMQNNLRLRSLLPTVTARFYDFDGPSSESRDSLLLEPGATVPRIKYRYNTIWTVFALWDLRDLISDPLQTSRAWVDVERLRERVTWGVQDSWAKWARTLTALADPTLTTRQRIYHELSRREASAYLHQMTGGRFAAFEPAEPAGALP